MIFNSYQLNQVKVALEKVLDQPRNYLKGYNLGVICNQASVNRKFQHIADLFYQNDKINLAALFGPQHGIRGDVQDNMVETEHKTDARTGLPVYSLYSETREPTQEMLEDLDALVFDLQDVGCRVYTFIYTMANAMTACAKFDKKFIVLDRPSPIGGIEVEGNVLEKGHESFVGQFPIPMRHGLTVGELAKLFNEEFSIGCDLEIVEMDGWKREYYLDETDAPWVMPSPNMPTVDTAVVFPGTVFLEGTQISEGRGTTRPFEIVGAPFIDGYELAEMLDGFDLPGIIFRPTEFLPTFQKSAGENCGGVFLHVTDRREFKPVITGIAIVKAICELYTDKFDWKNTPYEYVFDRNPFDVIAGNLNLRKSLENGITLWEIEASWQEGLNEFEKIREKYLIY